LRGEQERSYASTMARAPFPDAVQVAKHRGWIRKRPGAPRRHRLLL